MTNRYLVTGAAGFIGSKVAELLLGDGHAVAGIDSVNDAYDARLKEWRLRQLQGRKGFAFHRADITDRAALRRLFATPPDAVIHLAARAGVRPSVQDPWVYYEANVTGTLNLLELCRAAGVRKFVLASSSSVYGDKNPVPFREDADTDHPVSPYAASKKAAETLAYAYHALHGMDVSVLRYFTVYGPAGRPDMSLFRFVQWTAEGRPVTIYGDGKQSRDFTYVEDIARGTIASLRSVGYEVFNLGSDRPVVLADALALIEELVGRKAAVRREPAQPGDIRATWADISKAQRMLQWEPKTPFRDGVAALVRWYLENRAWAKDIVTE